MILTENVGLHQSGKELVKRRSDRNVMLHKIGTEEYYSDPIDLVDAPWSYEETDIPVEDDEPEEVTDGSSE